jgi:hypothetical protein
VFDEEEVLPELGRRLQTVLDPLGVPSEVILVDDGSRDGRYEQMLGFPGRSRSRR